MASAICKRLEGFIPKRSFSNIRGHEDRRSKETKKEQPKQEKEKVEFPEGAESFSQTTKDEEIICFCCGKPGEYANECPMRKQIAENNWFKNTGVKHYLKGKQVNAQVATGAVKSDDPKEQTKGTTQKSKLEKKVGFVVLH